MGCVLADAHQLSALQVDTKHATAGVAGVVLGGVEPFAIAVEHAVAVEVPVGWRRQHLQQASVTRVDQVTRG